MTRLSKRIFIDPITGEAPPIRLCDHEGCTAEGLYPAPRSPEDLRRYHWFCLPHVQEYNRRWDFYRDMPQEAIETSREDDRLWNRLRSSRASLDVEAFLSGKQSRPATESDIPPAWRDLDLPTLQALRESLSILGLSNPRVDFDTIQKTYKALAKKHHPDQQHTTAEDEDKMKDINAAYALMRRHRMVFGG
ncbi:MAG: J domain-containing protein [Alphaproteobacteria bacterium]